MRWALALVLPASLLLPAGRDLGAESRSALEVPSDPTATSSLAPVSGHGPVQGSGRATRPVTRRNDGAVVMHVSKAPGSPQTSPAPDTAVLDGSDRAERSKALMLILLFVNNHRR